MREAVIHIPHSEFEKIGLGDFITVFRDAGLRDITELSCETDGCLMVITVESPIAEESLASVDYLEWWERLSGEEDKEVYLCKIAFPGFEENIQPMYSALSTDEIQVSSDGFDVAVVDSQEDIAHEIQEYEKAGMTVLLERIADYAGPRETLDALTERQREILQTAYELGYFDVPRGVSTSDIANTLELDASTVAEHLQRAERNIVGNLLATP